MEGKAGRLVLQLNELEFSEVCMLDNKGFDLWADGYDQTVGVSDEENTYPFAGYREVLGTVYRIVTSPVPADGTETK